MIKLFTPQKLHLAELSLSQQVVPIAFLVRFLSILAAAILRFLQSVMRFGVPKIAHLCGAYYRLCVKCLRL